MYLSSLRLWNFRKFGSVAFDLNKPDLQLCFDNGISVLIGENDSGKTAVIDAIKLVLKTNSAEWIRVDWSDFHHSATRLRIECRFDDLKAEEAQHFTEWLAWEGDGDDAKCYLTIFLDVSRTDDKILPADVRAGIDGDGYILTAEAKEKLKTTYLRPLRDAKNELVPKRNSRLSQILSTHKAFQGKDQTHQFVQDYAALNNTIKAYFRGQKSDGSALEGDGLLGKGVKTAIDTYLNAFSQKTSKFETTDSSLKSILESLSLLFEDGINLGLGSNNLLAIASELLHLQKENWDGLRLGLVEEIEAHLHPQIQLQVIETLQTKATGVQLIFTTHSPNIGSKIPLGNLIIFQEGQAYPMGVDHTHLDSTDYTYLQRFLDVTKANLFFARGVILVEGWAEELIIPSIAKKLGINLTASGVSIINIGNTAFLRFSNIFKRQHAPLMKVPVAVITDVDVKPREAKVTKTVKGTSGAADIEVELTQEEIAGKLAASIKTKDEKYSGQVVSTFVSPYWTLEYCIALSPKLQQIFYKSVLEALLEQKNDEGVERLDAYNNAITNLANHFSNWTLSAEQIAYQIYDHIINGKTDIAGIAKEPISKSIIAQRFALNLDEATIDELGTENSIAYLIKAIEYASTRL